MEDVLFILPAELHTFMLVHIGYRRSIRHHFGTIAFKNRIQYANDWAQKISVHIPMRKAAIRVKAKRTRWNTWFQRVGGDGEIRTLAGFYTPTAFRVQTLQPLGYISEWKIFSFNAWITWFRGRWREDFWRSSSQIVLYLLSINPCNTKVFTLSRIIPCNFL